jgi:hypothetical protein
VKVAVVHSLSLRSGSGQGVGTVFAKMGVENEVSDVSVTERLGGHGLVSQPSPSYDISLYTLRPLINLNGFTFSVSLSMVTKACSMWVLMVII